MKILELIGLTFVSLSDIGRVLGIWEFSTYTIEVSFYVRQFLDVAILDSGTKPRFCHNY